MGIRGKTRTESRARNRAQPRLLLLLHFPPPIAAATAAAAEKEEAVEHKQTKEVHAQSIHRVVAARGAAASAGAPAAAAATSTTFRAAALRQNLVLLLPQYLVEAGHGVLWLQLLDGHAVRVGRVPGPLHDCAGAKRRNAKQERSAKSRTHGVAA
jgi:hypothetical protein